MTPMLTGVIVSVTMGPGSEEVRMTYPGTVFDSAQLLPPPRGGGAEWSLRQYELPVSGEAQAVWFRRVGVQLLLG